MEFRIHKSVLLEPLLTAAKAVQGKAVVDALFGLLISVVEEGMKVTGGSFDMSVQTEIPASDFDVVRTGAVIITASELTELVKKMPDKLIHFQVGESFRCKIQTEKIRTELAGMDPEMYPTGPTGLGETISIDSKNLHEVLIRTAYAVAPETEIARPALTGIHFVVRDGRIIATGSDSKRIAQVIVNEDCDGEVDVVIPGKAVKTIDKLIDYRHPAEVSMTRSGMTIKQPGYTFRCSTMNQEYPAAGIERLLGSETRTNLTVNRSEFIMALERARITSKDDGKGAQVILANVMEGQLTITTQSSNGSSEESIEASSFIGSQTRVAFNAKYAIAAVDAIGSEFIEIRLGNSNTPIFFMPQKIEQVVHMVAPLMVRELTGNDV